MLIPTTIALLVGAAALAIMILIERYLVTGKLNIRKWNRSESETGIDSKRGTGRPRIQITGPKVKPLICQI